MDFEEMLSWLDHVEVPAGTWMVSPVTAAVTQAETSVKLELAAVREGLEPEQAAHASEAQSINAN